MNVPDSTLLQRVDPRDRKLTCERCKSTSQPRFTENGPHIKAECNNCGAYIKFVKQIPQEKEQAPFYELVANKDYESLDGEGKLPW